MASDAASGPARAPGWFGRLTGAARGEGRAVVAGFLLFFLVFSSYFMLRPVRETMGIAGGVDNLQWLFLGTFLATLVVVPLYGWVARTVPRRQLLPVTYGVSAATLAGFGFGMAIDPDNIWLARAFYIWISVFNLFAVSIAWSLMADVLRPSQAKRLFGQVAAGASLGGLAGPLAGGLLVERIGHPGLLFLSATLLLGSLACVGALLRWRDAARAYDDPPAENTRPIGGGTFAGLSLIARSPYLLAISLFVILLATANTFLYFEQARLVEQVFPDRTDQTQVFSAIDVVVQSLTILVQVFVTGQLTRRLGVTFLLTAIPLAMVAGFAALAVAAVFPVLVVVMVLRRVGEYALIRPGREMLFTAVDPETKYKAKNAIDTVVYRGGDAVSAWVKTGIDAAAASPAVTMSVGAVLALGWAATGWAIGRRHDARAE